MARSVLAEAALDQRHQLGEPLLGGLAADGELDGVALAAPSIISPRIDPPAALCPSLATRTAVPTIAATAATNFALARACSPRLLTIVTSRLASPKAASPLFTRPGRGTRRRS
jgi:hypothetical protein